MLPVYVDDVAEAIALALTRGAPGRAYTIWSGEEVGFAEYLERLAALEGATPPRRLPRPVLVALGAGLEGVARLRGLPPLGGRHGPTLVDRRGTVSNARARAELGWEPRVSLEEGLRRTGEWLRGAA